MKRVISLQTEDGQLFTDKCAALTHELKLNLKGVMSKGGKLAKDITFGEQAIETAALYMVANVEDFYLLMQKYRENMRRANCEVKKEVDSGE